MHGQLYPLSEFPGGVAKRWLVQEIIRAVKQ